jgi:hypothetical protein
VRGFELLDRARDGQAKLLAVERLPSTGGDEQLAAAFLLVFDAGRILVAGDAAAGELCAMHIDDEDAAPSGLQSSLEDEPWWRVIGSPLCGAWAESDGRVLRLQLRADADAPRFVTLALEGESVRSALAEAPN